MTLSICTICQDEEEPIKWFLESCKHTFSILQDHLSEIVLVDGGSKDNTIDIIKEYQKGMPIKLLERPWDYPAVQMNFGLTHCTGSYVFTPDADMTWTTNFPDLFLTNYFTSSRFWDFIILFTCKDAYHYFYKNPVIANIRMHRRGPKWAKERKYHVLLEGQPPQIPVCKDVIIFENSSRIKSDKALLNRGERRQKDSVIMKEEGWGPGPPDRFYKSARTLDSDLRHINNYNNQISSLVLASTDA